jgi:hypothetical protein
MWGGRPTLFAVAVMNVITGLGFAISTGADNFGVDSGLFRHCALLLAEGGGGFCPSFPYPPLTQVAAIPLTWLSPTAAMVAMSLIGIAILVAGVVLETRGHAVVDRLLVSVAVLTFVPVVYELLLGQTTLLIAAAVYPVVRRPDAFRNGIPLGFALALAPKPMLLPLLVWMLVWRRQSLTTAIVAAMTLTSVGIALLGFAQYLDWFAVLSGDAHQVASGSFWLSSPDKGNHSLWPLNPATFVLACIVGAVTLWAIRRDASRGFVASLFAGLLLAPYSLPYAYSILLLAVKPALTFAPRATRALALTANLAAGFLIGLLTAWSIAGLAACLTFKRSGRLRVGKSG